VGAAIIAPALAAIYPPHCAAGAILAGSGAKRPGGVVAGAATPSHKSFLVLFSKKEQLP
jgi:hypothetical protein